jgi:hypothetical protein
MRKRNYAFKEISLPPEVWDQVQEAARFGTNENPKSVTMSAWVREAVAEKLERKQVLQQCHEQD